jgi:hypothetical protein
MDQVEADLLLRPGSNPVAGGKGAESLQAKAELDVGADFRYI